jgi:hypothetical protein
MDPSVEARIAALEEHLAALKSATLGQPAAAAPQLPPAPAELAPVSRRHMLWAGGAAAVGAAGAAFATASPAGAQTAPTASQVSFTPTGNIGANNVQVALTEVDSEKAGFATGGEFSAPVTFGDARSKLFPIVDARAWGAVNDGSVDTAQKIRDAITWAHAMGGATVFLPPGRYRFDSKIVVPGNVDLWGGGGHGQNNTSGTVLIAGAAAAQLEFQGQGGQSGNFGVRGNGVANPANGLVYLGVGTVERTFTALRVTGSLTDGMVIESAQNCSFNQVMVAQHGRDGLVLDKGAGGHSFMRCEFGACVHDGVVIRETPPAPPPNTAYPNPQHNLFLHCIFERASGPNFDGPSHAQLAISAGKNNLFNHCVFSRQTPPPDQPPPGEPGFFLIVCTGGLTTFEHSVFTSEGAGGLWNKSAGVNISGVTMFRNPTAIRWDGPSAFGETSGIIRYEAINNVTTVRWTGDGGWENKSVGSNVPFLALVEPQANFGLRVQQVGQAAARFNVGKLSGNSAVTTITVTNGDSAAAKAEWRLQADGTGWETPDDVFLNGGALAIQEVATDPPPPPSGTRAVMYVKADKLIVAFTQGATTHYKYLTLTGTSATWTNSDVPPT